VRIDVVLDQPEVFQAGRTVWLVGPREEGSKRPLTIEFFRAQHGRFILKLHGVDSIAEAKAIAGSEVCIEPSELPQIPDGMFYTFDLKGCQVEAVGGEHLGIVSDVLGVGEEFGTPILKVEGKSGEILIPFARIYLKAVDIQHRRIEVDLPAGLRDLNT
jgi:16S rRNA processing protein RimM